MFDGSPPIELRSKQFRTAGQIKAAFARHYGITVADIEGHCRKWKFAHPRQMAMALCQRRLGWSMPRIARAFGGRNHVTVYFACRKFGYEPTPEASRLGFQNGFGRGRV